MKSEYEFSVIGSESGKALYSAKKKGVSVAMIRYFDKKALRAAGIYDLDPHWAVLHNSGRIDRWESLGQCKDEVRKS